jgi:hypothetical protein
LVVVVVVVVFDGDKRLLPPPASRFPEIIAIALIGVGDALAALETTAYVLGLASWCAASRAVAGCSSD